MIQYRLINISSSTGLTVVNVLQGHNVSIHAITTNDLTTLINNYITFLQYCPDYTLQTPELVQQSSNSNNNNYFFTPLCGGMIGYATDYFNLIKGIVEQHATNAIVSNSLQNLQAESALLQQLYGIVQNVVPRSGVIKEGNPATLKDFLAKGIDIVNGKINTFAQTPRLNY